MEFSLGKGKDLISGKCRHNFFRENLQPKSGLCQVSSKKHPVRAKKRKALQLYLQGFTKDLRGGLHCIKTACGGSTKRWGKSVFGNDALRFTSQFLQKIGITGLQKRGGWSSDRTLHCLGVFKNTKEIV